MYVDILFYKEVIYIHVLSTQKQFIWPKTYINSTIYSVVKLSRVK